MKKMKKIAKSIFGKSKMDILKMSKTRFRKIDLAKKTRFFDCDHYALICVFHFFICDDNFFFKKIK